MNTTSSFKPLPGSASLIIPFPEPGDWMEKGRSLDLGRFQADLCSGNLFKTIENKLYVYLRVVTWPGLVKAHMPLRVPAEGADASTLHIQWAGKQVRLQQDDHPPIYADWQQLD